MPLITISDVLSMATHSGAGPRVGMRHLLGGRWDGRQVSRTAGPGVASRGESGARHSSATAGRPSAASHGHCSQMPSDAHAITVDRLVRRYGARAVVDGLSF